MPRFWRPEPRCENGVMCTHYVHGPALTRWGSRAWPCWCCPSAWGAIAAETLGQAAVWFAMKQTMENCLQQTIEMVNIAARPTGLNTGRISIRSSRPRIFSSCAMRQRRIRSSSCSWSPPRCAALEGAGYECQGLGGAVRDGKGLGQDAVHVCH
jgi:hypothetical protein